MAFRGVLHRRVVPITTCLLGAGVVVAYRVPNAYAEAPKSLFKKPIYDDAPNSPELEAVLPSAAPSDTTSSLPSIPQSSNPTPTDRLAAEIRRARLFLYAHASATEDGLNRLMDSALDLETSFTSTIASLAPPKESGEKLMPGVIYVLVATMAGSIVSRNRNILLRAMVPLAAGVGTSWLVMPITSRNVGDLLWRYEQKTPFISENHLRIRNAAEQAWMLARDRGRMAIRAVDETAQGGREKVEEWVRKGK